MNTQRYLINTYGDQCLMALVFITEIPHEENANITIAPVNVMRMEGDIPNISISDHINAVVSIVDDYKETLTKLLNDKGIPTHHDIIIQKYPHLGMRKFSC